jgi:hypothetical protein
MGLFCQDPKVFGIVTNHGPRGLGPSFPLGAWRWRRYHPAIPPPISMAVELSVTDCTQRLAGQLRALSEVTETLTVRLLELEERLLAQESKLEPLMAEDTEFRMADTEDRLSRLEGLLSGGSLPGGSPMGTDRFRAVRELRPGLAAEEIQQESFLEVGSQEVGFQEDGFLQDDFQEQPFLDELSA